MKKFLQGVLLLFLKAVHYFTSIVVICGLFPIPGQVIFISIGMMFDPINRTDGIAILIMWLVCLIIFGLLEAKLREI